MKIPNKAHIQKYLKNTYKTGFDFMPDGSITYERRCG